MRRSGTLVLMARKLSGSGCVVEKLSPKAAKVICGASRRSGRRDPGRLESAAGPELNGRVEDAEIERLVEA
jgi:hypothetical protein